MTLTIRTPPPKVTHISKHVMWLALGKEELLIAFERFTQFKQATVAQLSDIQQPHLGQLYWPQLDVDVSVESLRKPVVLQANGLQANGLQTNKNALASHSPSPSLS